MYGTIYKITADYVTQMFEETYHPNLIYHNLLHTKNVVEHAQEIAAQYELTDDDMLALYVAAWFHDTGHLFTEQEAHEEKSVELMRQFMEQQLVTEEIISKIERCIMATHMPHQP